MSKAVKASFADLAIKQSKKDSVPGPGRFTPSFTNTYQHFSSTKKRL